METPRLEASWSGVFFFFSEEKEQGDRRDFIEMQRGEAEDGYDFR